MKKLILFIFSIFIFHCQLKANFNSKNVITGDTIKKNKSDSLIIKNETPSPPLPNQFSNYKAPKFNYNGKTFNDYLDDSLKIPEKYKTLTFEYKVSFIITKEGKVSNVKLLNFSKYIELDNLIYRIVKNLPDYIPAKENGVSTEAPCRVVISYTPEE